MKIFNVGWRNDFNWMSMFFRVVAETPKEANALASRLSGKREGSISCQQDDREFPHLPIYINGEFVYTAVAVYSNKQSNSKVLVNGKWMSHKVVNV